MYYYLLLVVLFIDTYDDNAHHPVNNAKLIPTEQQYDIIIFYAYILLSIQNYKTKKKIQTIKL